MSYVNLYKENKAFDGRTRVLRKRILEADLTNAVNGSPQSVALRTEGLPAGVTVLAHAINVATLFTGGGATSVGLTIGYAGQLNALVSALELNNATPTGRWVQGTSGASPVGGELAGQQVLATFTPDASHNLAALTAGDLTIELYYSLPDLGPDRT